MKRRGPARAPCPAIGYLPIVVLAAALLALDASAPTPSRVLEAQAGPPRLLVLLVVDQFRADYLDWYGDQWTGGLRRLLDNGAVFPRATLPYAVTKTCAGHASIATGTVPATHGMIDNDWFDRTRRRFVTCTSDSTAQSIAFGDQPGSEQHSATWLRAPTIGDELRRQARQPPRIVSVALKARSAISLGGHGGRGTIIFWEEDSGRWATSSAFASAPWPEVDAYIRANPTLAARGQVWNRLLESSVYRHEDRAPGEPSAATFPHPLLPPPGASFASVWDMSPWSDAYLGDMAGTLAGRLGLGRRDSTDLLAVGFSALDYIGHSFGPRSHEVQDTIVRLDQVIGRLLHELDTLVGREHYVVAFSSDHGVALLPEQARSVTGQTGGRINPNALGLAIEIALTPHLGERPLVEAVTSTYVHFLPGVLARIRANPAAIEAVESMAMLVNGIERVFWSEDLAGTASAGDPALDALRKSYVAARSGDLAYLPRANWVVASAGTHHGSMHAYDTQVPMVFMGRGITPGRADTGSARAATPIDIAPTLAALAGITMPQADGRALTEIFAR